MTYQFVIHGRPMTKKNSLQKTRYGLVQGKAYREYAKDALWQLKAQRRPIKPIGCAVTMTARYYMPNRKGWPDLFGLLQATADILEKAGVLEDDGFVATVGNSRIEGVSDWPRVEVTVTELPPTFVLNKLHPKLRKRCIK